MPKKPKPHGKPTWRSSRNQPQATSSPQLAPATVLDSIMWVSLGYSRPYERPQITSWLQERFHRISKTHRILADTKVVCFCSSGHLKPILTVVYASLEDLLPSSPNLTLCSHLLPLPHSSHTGLLAIPWMNKDTGQSPTSRLQNLCTFCFCAFIAFSLDICMASFLLYSLLMCHLIKEGLFKPCGRDIDCSLNFHVLHQSPWS